MHEDIEAIIESIPPGHIFDSHFIISRLIKLKPDTYLDFASSIDASSGKTLAVHGNIGQAIARLSPIVIEQLPHKAWSENIRGNISACACWRKLENS